MVHNAMFKYGFISVGPATHLENFLLSLLGEILSHDLIIFPIGSPLLRVLSPLLPGIQVGVCGRFSHVL